EEVRLFFRDLLSPDEIAMLSRRIEVALLLQAGFTYREIEEALGVGADKILNVQKSLSLHGEGYKLVLKRLRKILRKRERKKEKIKKEKTSFSPLTKLKKKYPGYFLLANLFDALDDWLNDDGKLNIEKSIESKRSVRKKESMKKRKGSKKLKRTRRESNNKKSRGDKN
ncbi:MAG: hypothetical protein DRH33_06765, partial [Candidatus Nealsonbacteria bacterium]